MSQVEYRTILRYRLMIPLFHIVRCALFVVRRAWILLGSMSFIVRSFPTLSRDMTLLGMYFLIYSDGREYQ